MADNYDWDHQHQETVWVWNDLQSKGIDFQRAYRLDIQFMPTASTADDEAFAATLRAAGYHAKFYRDDRTVQATTPAIVLTLESVWEHERRTTEIALRCGFRPDGWGFLED
jgi:hypothetical protein